ncbi:nascent polypeptide-associated complex subunit alpha, muscle-specific form-like [Tachyglossus aculeatus]|uniref:nascent polypeptide-associated complex subunit alpha, muscle-specific form-like n=1 Tax=Tachyglossus aculeatus TaxID=9261 RepID=UPI0018F5C840|nr:nascent polypeptide-associated complex subunit alpha, muscle-specific form-like [Tachyglossus aculeatus]
MTDKKWSAELTAMIHSLWPSLGAGADPPDQPPAPPNEDSPTDPLRRRGEELPAAQRSRWPVLLPVAACGLLAITLCLLTSHVTHSGGRTSAVSSWISPASLPRWALSNHSSSTPPSTLYSPSISPPLFPHRDPTGTGESKGLMLRRVSDPIPRPSRSPRGLASPCGSETSSGLPPSHPSLETKSHADWREESSTGHQRPQLASSTQGKQASLRKDKKLSSLLYLFTEQGTLDSGSEASQKGKVEGQAGALELNTVLSLQAWTEAGALSRRLSTGNGQLLGSQPGSQVEAKVGRLSPDHLGVATAPLLGAPSSPTHMSPTVLPEWANPAVSSGEPGTHNQPFWGSTEAMATDRPTGTDAHSSHILPTPLSLTQQEDTAAPTPYPSDDLTSGSLVHPSAMTSRSLEPRTRRPNTRGRAGRDSYSSYMPLGKACPPSTAVSMVTGPGLPPAKRNDVTGMNELGLGASVPAASPPDPSDVPGVSLKLLASKTSNSFLDPTGIPNQALPSSTPLSSSLPVTLSGQELGPVYNPADESLGSGVFPHRDSQQPTSLAEPSSPPTLAATTPGLPLGLSSFSLGLQRTSSRSLASTAKPLPHPAGDMALFPRAEFPTTSLGTSPILPKAVGTPPGPSGLSHLKSVSRVKAAVPAVVTALALSADPGDLQTLETPSQSGQETSDPKHLTVNVPTRGPQAVSTTPSLDLTARVDDPAKISAKSREAHETAVPGDLEIHTPQLPGDGSNQTPSTAAGGWLYASSSPGMHLPHSASPTENSLLGQPQTPSLGIDSKTRVTLVSNTLPTSLPQGDSTSSAEGQEPGERKLGPGRQTPETPAPLTPGQKTATWSVEIPPAIPERQLHHTLQPKDGTVSATTAPEKRLHPSVEDTDKTRGPSFLKPAGDRATSGTVESPIGSPGPLAKATGNVPTQLAPFLWTKPRLLQASLGQLALSRRALTTPDAALPPGTPKHSASLTKPSIPSPVPSVGTDTQDSPTGVSGHPANPPESTFPSTDLPLPVTVPMLSTQFRATGPTTVTGWEPSQMARLLIASALPKPWQAPDSSLSPHSDLKGPATTGQWAASIPEPQTPGSSLSTVVLSSPPSLNLPPVAGSSLTKEVFHDFPPLQVGAEVAGESPRGEGTEQSDSLEGRRLELGPPSGEQEPLSLDKKGPVTSEGAVALPIPRAAPTVSSAELTPSKAALVHPSLVRGTTTSLLASVRASDQPTPPTDASFLPSREILAPMTPADTGTPRGLLSSASPPSPSSGAPGWSPKEGPSPAGLTRPPSARTEAHPVLKPVSKGYVPPLKKGPLGQEPGYFPPLAVLPTLPLQFRLTGIAFTEPLEDEYSVTYRRLKTEVTLTLRKMLFSLKGFHKINILGFLNGSITVQSEVEFQEDQVPSSSTLIRTIVTMVQEKMDTYFSWRVDLASLKSNGYGLGNLEPEILPVFFIALRLSSAAALGVKDHQSPLAHLKYQVVYSVGLLYPVETFFINSLRDVQGDLAVQGEVVVHSLTLINTDLILQKLKRLANYSVDLRFLTVADTKLTLQEVPISFLVTNRRFKEQLLTRSSSEHQGLSRDLSELVMRVLSSYSSLLQVMVEDFLGGSLICMGTLVFQDPLPNTKDLLHTLADSIALDYHFAGSDFQVDPRSFQIAGERMSSLPKYQGLSGSTIGLIVISLLFLTFMIIVALCLRTRMFGYWNRGVFSPLHEVNVHRQTFELENQGFEPPREEGNGGHALAADNLGFLLTAEDDQEGQIPLPQTQGSEAPGEAPSGKSLPLASCSSAPKNG